MLLAKNQKTKKTDNVASRLPLKKIVYNKIHDDIISGKHAVDTYLLKEYDYADKYQVSRKTISLALKQLREEGFIESEHRVGWRVLKTKKADKKEKKPILVYSSEGMGTLKIMFPLLKQKLKDKGYAIDLELIDNVAFKRGEYPTLINEDVSAVVSLFPSSLPDSILVKCLEKNIPVCAITLQEECSYDTVANNRASSSKMAVEYLVEKGHKNIIYISVKDFLDRKISTFLAGKLGYEQAMITHDLPVEVLLNDINLWSRDTDEKLFIDRIIAMQKEGRVPTAIYAEMNHINSYLVPILSRNGYRVPEDISLIGIGDESEDFHLESYGINRITSIVPKYEDMVDSAVESIIGRIEGTKKTGGLVTFKPVIHEGDTVRKIKKGEKK